MKLYMLDCPSCGAAIEVEETRKSCFCTYCGRKVYVDDDVKRVEINKKITYHTIITDEAKIKKVESEERIEHLRHDAEIEQQKRENKAKLIGALKPIAAFVAVLLLIVGYFASIDIYFDSEKEKSDQQEIQLQELVDEIMVDIENHEFESARVKAQSIHYTEGWSSEIEEKWDETRKEILKQIDKAEKDWKKENDKTWWNPFD